jgi:hypothetical protein
VRTAIVNDVLLKVGTDYTLFMDFFLYVLFRVRAPFPLGNVEVDFKERPLPLPFFGLKAGISLPPAPTSDTDGNRPWWRFWFLR